MPDAKHELVVMSIPLGLWFTLPVPRFIGLQIVVVKNSLQIGDFSLNYKKCLSEI